MATNIDCTNANSYFTEIKGNLFSAPESASLAHCVSEDLQMGKGIAILFRDKFGEVDTLRAQKKKIGEVAVLSLGNSRYVFYLITKIKYSHSPKLADLRLCLIAMCDFCLSNGVTELCMPQIGSGLDKLNWTKVKQEIKTAFKDTGIYITVYYL